MKKLIALLLAAAMLLSLTACGGSAEPAETTPATTEPVVVETEAPTEAPTEEPTEAPTEPRVAPVDFTPVDTTTLPAPTSVDELLENSEDTQTVHFDTLEEYEDLLWSLGFEEVRLAGTHIGLGGVQGSCINSALTYNSEVFRLDFSYCLTTPTGETQVQENWMMCGMKANARGNITNLNMMEYIQAEKLTSYTINLEGIDLESFDFEQFAQNFNPEQYAANTTKNETTYISPKFESEIMGYTSKDTSNSVDILVVYYPMTGTLFNYMQRPIGQGLPSAKLNTDYSSTGVQAQSYGTSAKNMCFHYVFPTEDAAE